MLKPAFSTIACPDWTLDRIADAAREYGFEAVELRTFGPASRTLAGDPALTDEAKTRRLFRSSGVEVLSLATSLAFDAPIRPPVIGLVISDHEKSVREARAAIDLAVAIECPLVRVFAFEVQPRDRRSAAVSRIASRLRAAADHARNTGVRIALENGGSFPTGAAIAEIVDRVASPLVGACYSLASAASAGEPVRHGVAALGEKLWAARVKDHRGGVPCALGQGDLPAREFVQVLAASGFAGPLVYEWDRLWLPELAPADQVLADAARTLTQWAAARSAPASPVGAH